MLLLSKAPEAAPGSTKSDQEADGRHPADPGEPLQGMAAQTWAT